MTEPTDPGDDALSDRILAGLKPGQTKAWVRVVRVVLSVALIAVMIGFVLPAVTHTTWPRILYELHLVDGYHLAGMFALEVCVILVYALALRVTIPGIHYRHALRTHNASTAIANSVPFGGALSLGLLYAMIRSYGFRRGTIALSLAMTTLADTITKLALPVLGLLALLLAGAEIPSALTWAALIAAVLGAIVLGTVIGVIASERFMRSLMTSLEESVVKAMALVGQQREVHIVAPVLRFRIRAMRILSHGWAQLFGPALGMRVLQFGIFWVALDGVGVDLNPLAIFAAFTLARLLAMIPLTPAGIGVTETGTAAFLAALGADPGLAAAATILYTLMTTVAQVPLGGLSALLWQVRRDATPPYGRAAEAARDRALAGSGAFAAPAPGTTAHDAPSGTDRAPHAADERPPATQDAAPGADEPSSGAEDGPDSTDSTGPADPPTP